jgi:Periviscerokinin family
MHLIMMLFLSQWQGLVGTGLSHLSKTSGLYCFPRII